MTVKVCDSIMGSGKTQSAITRMNEDTNSRYIFITPYLDEVDRIKKSCTERKFFDPHNKGEGKLEDLHRLLRAGRNIASTHALFRRYNSETIELLREGGYKLILDEVCEVVENLHISQDDLKILLDEQMIRVDVSGKVEWIKGQYEGKFEELREICDTGNVTLYNGYLMVWTFPFEVFEAFRDVIVLTYLFDAQVQKYYFDMNGVKVQKIGTVYERGEYRFSDIPHVPSYVKELKSKVHILEDTKLNRIGEAYTALSSSWYNRARKAKGRPEIRQMKNNLVNVFINRFDTSAERNLWTVFKDHRDILKGKGYTKGFLAYNVRATNKYRMCDHLAFCVNVFYNPVEKNYFTDHGVQVKEDEYALGEMIQWIWRSAIRDGKEIWVYIPSSRMRGLLVEWLDSLLLD